MTNKWVGGFIRRKLRLPTHKSRGVYVVPKTEQPKIIALAERFGVGARRNPQSYEQEPGRQDA